MSNRKSYLTLMLGKEVLALNDNFFLCYMPGSYETQLAIMYDLSTSIKWITSRIPLVIYPTDYSKVCLIITEKFLIAKILEIELWKIPMKDLQ